MTLMAMKLGCCISGACYDLAAAAGYDSIAFPGVELAAAEDERFEQMAAKVAAGPLSVFSVNSFCPDSLRLTGADLDLAALEAYARRLFPRAAGLGAKYIGIGGPVSRSTRPGESTASAVADLERSLTLLCHIGEEYGLTILLESVCALECNVVTYTHEAADIVRRLKPANLGLVYDIYHAHMMHEDPDYILQVAELIRVVHIARNVDNKRGYLREENIPEYLPYIRALVKAGYDGECNMEAFAGDLIEELPRSKRILERLISGSEPPF